MSAHYADVEDRLLHAFTDGGVDPMHARNGPPPEVPDHELLRRIGGGSYGEVWIARNVVGTYRAVKLVFRDRFGSARPYEREFHGMQSYEPVSRRHEGLVDILQIGRSDEDGFFYYIMELADDAEGGPALAAIPDDVRRAMLEAGRRHRSSTRTGATLTGDTAPEAAALEIEPNGYRPRTLRSEIRKNGRLAPGDCVHLFLTLTAALSSLHRYGLLHRDIKPSNIVIVGGVPKLADIGLVSVAGSEMSFVGTEGFIPPEGPGTEQADIFSLGKVLYEAFSGMDRMEYPQLPPVEKGKLGDLQPLMELNAVVTRACAPKAEDRYANAAEMLGDLALLQAGRSVKSARALEGKLRVARRWGLTAAGCGVVVAGALGVRAWFDNERAEYEHGARQQVEAAHYSQSLALARAECLSPEMGHRFRALEALRTAAEKQAGDLVELRSQAVTALALPDLKVMDRRPTVALPSGAYNWTSWDRKASLRALYESDGGMITVERAEDGAGTDRFKAAGAVQALLTISPDGRYLPYILANKQLVLRDLAEHRDAALPAGLTTSRHALEWAPDSRCFIFNLNGVLSVLDIGSGATRDLAAGISKESVGTTPVSLRGTVAVSQQNGRHINIVDVATGRITGMLDLDAGMRGTQVGLSPDGSRMVASGEDWNVRMWSVDDLKAPPVVLSGHSAFIGGLNFHEGGELLVTSSWDGTTRLFRVSDGRPCGVTRAALGPGVVFTGDGTRGLTLDLTTMEPVILRFEDAAACRVIGEPPGSHADLSPAQAVFIAEGRVLASASGDGVRFYDTATGLPLGHAPGTMTSLIAWSEQSGTLLTGCHLNTPTRQRHVAEKDGVLTIAAPEVVSAEPGMQLQINADDTIRAITTRSAITVYPKTGAPAALEASSGNLCGVISPDGKYMTGRGGDNITRVWSVATRKVLWKIPSSGTMLPGFSADSLQLLLCGTGSVRGYGIADGKELWTGPIPGAHSGMVVASPDGKLLACRTSGMTLHLLDAVTHDVLCRLEHPDPTSLQYMTWSPDSSMIAICSGRHSLMLWDLRRLRRELKEVGLDWKHPEIPEAAARARITRVVAE